MNGQFTSPSVANYTLPMAQRTLLSSIFGYGISAAFLAIALAVPGFALFEAGKSLYYNFAYQHQTGIVVSCESRSVSGRSTKYATVVKTTDGVRITARWFGSKPACTEKIGFARPVLIDPENHRNGVINTFNERWLIPCCVLLLLTLLLWGVVRKRQRR